MARLSRHPRRSKPPSTAAPDNPKNAEAYYQYGLSLAGQATVDKEGKFVAPPGTLDAFNKYLALAPNGQKRTAGQRDDHAARR
ncbi:MAG: hypothetical protein WDO73_06715 [Ignavibacteriota bacterium]